MPIYEYTCQKCGREFEELVSVSAEKNPPCPSCNSEDTEKRLSAIGSTSGAGGNASCSSSRFT